MTVDPLTDAIRQVRDESRAGRAPVLWQMWIPGVRGPGWPARLVDGVADVLPQESLAESVVWAWRASGCPAEVLDPSRWRQLFAMAGGYIENGRTRPRPDGSVWLYRGSPRRTMRGWSWADTYAIAELYRLRRAAETRAAGLRVERSSVWVARVPWTSVLAHTRSRRGSIDDELTVDTDGLRIQLLDTTRKGHWPHCTQPRAGLDIAGLLPFGGPSRSPCIRCGGLV